MWQWMKSLLKSPYPDPAVGQIWRSENSGNLLRVTEVETTDEGLIVVMAQGEMPQKSAWGTTSAWLMPDLYCYGLVSSWRARLKRERRVLIMRGHVPRPGPWPEPPPK